MGKKNEDSGRWKPSADVAWRRVGDEAVVLHVPSSVYFSLNDSAAFLWERLAGGESAEEAAAELETAYEVATAQARRDAAALLAELRDEGLLVPR
jgi:hypothetical protein